MAGVSKAKMPKGWGGGFQTKTFHAVEGMNIFWKNMVVIKRSKTMRVHKGTCKSDMSNVLRGMSIGKTEQEFEAK